MASIALRAWVVGVCLALALPVYAQEGLSSASRHEERLHEFQPVPHTTKAVDYKQGTSSKVKLKGTSLMPDLEGDAEVKTRTGRAEIEVHLDHLKPANTINLNDLTYVLWAISPEGRATNVGELIANDDKASIKTATPMQAFALIVTAEPYFAVSQPSDQIVAENVIDRDTNGAISSVDVNYGLIPRAAYGEQIEPLQKPVYGIDKKTPLSLVEARNAVRIAKSADADEYAGSAFQAAQQQLSQAEDYYQRKQSTKSIDTVARAAVQSAETARVTALKAEEQARQDQQREEQSRRTEEARQQSEKAQADAQQAQQQAQLEAQQRAVAAQQAAQAQSDADRARQQAQLEAQQRAAAEQQAQLAQQQAQQAQQQMAQTRAQLLAQLNQVLETRDTARGLIVSMPDVLFDTGKADLRPEARERLAKVAGILIAYPDIKVEIDGYTDSTGTAELNQRLSEERAEAVRSYMSSQGVSADKLTTHGFGEENPVASNDTSSGRQQNRRVELVVTGQSIGTQGQP